VTSGVHSWDRLKKFVATDVNITKQDLAAVRFRQLPVLAFLAQNALQNRHGRATGRETTLHQKQVCIRTWKSGDKFKTLGYF